MQIMKVIKMHNKHMNVTERKNIYENRTQACQSIMICENHKQKFGKVTKINENHYDL